MYFENIDTSYNNENFSQPIKAKIRELYIEKENLEEYFRQLIFIKNILDYILIEYSSKERQSFEIKLKEPKYNYLNYYIYRSLNSLLYDNPSDINTIFSKPDIEKYIEKLKQEIHSVNARLTYIIRDIHRYTRKYN